MTDDDRNTPSGYASPACLAHEVDPTGAPPANVACWRKAQRERLRAARAALPVESRARIDQALARHLDALLARRFGDPAGRVVSGYWPIKGEPDLRAWLTSLHQRGATIALPVVETRAKPLVFRRWKPGDPMQRGFWNIPVPRDDAIREQPEIALAPLVGWDGEGFRLGYGGGYFDRTIAAAAPRPFVIGVGLQAARLASIHPQPHDMIMNAIVTEAGTQWEEPPGKDPRG